MTIEEACNKGRTILMHFAEIKENIPPAARGNNKWQDARVMLTLADYKWWVGWGAMSLGWEVWGSECADGLCAPFPLLCCPAHKK